MATSNSIYSHRCTLPDCTLWFGRATLYEDRVSIRGWTWRGRYRRTVAVEDIDEIEWRPRPTKPNLILSLENGDTLRLRLRKGARLWNAKLHDLLDESLLDGRSLPKNGHGESGEASEAEDTEENEDQETA